MQPEKKIVTTPLSLPPGHRNLEILKDVDSKIEKGQFQDIIDSLKDIPGELHPSIAQKIIGAEKHYVTEETLHTEGKSPEDIIGIIAKTDPVWIAVQNLSKFQGIDPLEISKDLLNSPHEIQTVSVSVNISKFNPELKSQLIDAHFAASKSDYLMDAIPFLSPEDRSTVANRIIDSRTENFHRVAYELGKFEKAEADIIFKKILDIGGNIAYTLSPNIKLLNEDHQLSLIKECFDPRNSSYLTYTAQFLADGVSDLKPKALSCFVEEAFAKKRIELLKNVNLSKQELLKVTDTFSKGYAGRQVQHYMRTFGEQQKIKLLNSFIKVSRKNSWPLHLDEMTNIIKELPPNIRKTYTLKLLTILDKEHHRDISLDLLPESDRKSVCLAAFKKFPNYRNTNCYLIHDLKIFPAEDRKDILKAVLNDYVSPEMKAYAFGSFESIFLDSLKKHAITNFPIEKETLIKLLKKSHSNSSYELSKMFDLEKEKKQADKLGIHLVHYLIAEKCLNKETPTESDFKDAFEILKKESHEWKNQENIVIPFTKAAEKLGYQFMLNYVNRNDMTLHDTCFALGKIIELPARFGVTDNTQQIKALTKILTEVKKDKSTVNNGNSYSRLNTIANSDIIAPKDFLAMLKDDIDFKDDTDTLKAAEEFNGSSQQICSSWRKLVKYADYTNFFIKNKTFAKKILELKRDGQHTKADFFNRIANNKESDVNLVALVEFMSEPDVFLARNDQHGDAATHDRKKPSNYTQIPHLGLTGQHLIDGLILGSLDKVQVIAPAAIEYKFPKEGMILSEDIGNLPVKDLIKKVLGSRKNNIPSLLSDSNFKKSFQQLQAKVNESSTERKIKFVEEFLNGTYEVNQDIETNLRVILREYLTAEDKIDSSGQRFLVKIHPKSSPDAIVAGDDTKCCMAFGSGKNNVYMFNPNCVQLTIQLVNEEGHPERTVAQSVVTLNLKTDKNIPAILNDVGKGINFHNMIPEESVKNSLRYLVCDSIETNANFIGKQGTHNTELLRVMYEDFFSHIMTQLPEEISSGHTLDKTKVFIPNGHFQGPFAHNYSDEANQYIPLAPMSYSDNTGESVRVLTPTEHNIKREVHGMTQIATNLQERGKTSELTFMDTLQVTYLEGKVYEGTTLTEALHNIQNGIIAKDIANSIRNTPNLSVKYLSSDGTMQGYLIAYEGVHDEAKEPCIYIGDFASKKRNSVEAGKLLLTFMDKYKEHYIDKKNLLPIYMEARDETSYRLLQRQLEKMSTKLGCKFTIQELATQQNGNDLMHSLKVTCFLD